MAEKDGLIRFGVAFPAPLFEQFDRFILQQGYTNRSEAIRDLARRALLEPSALSSDAHAAGTIVMLYDHHVRELPLLLMELQHHYHHHIISTMHVHLNHHQCLEVLIVRGRMSVLRELHRQIQAQKGVDYAELSVTFTDGEGKGAGQERKLEYGHGPGEDGGDGRENG